MIIIIIAITKIIIETIYNFTGDKKQMSFFRHGSDKKISTEPDCKDIILF